MRTVVRNSFARQSIRSERIRITLPHAGCTECGAVRQEVKRYLDPHDPRVRSWLYRFHVDDDSGPRHSGPIAGGRLFCSRECAETFVGQPFDECAGGR